MIRTRQNTSALSREDGFTLPELLWAMTILVGLVAIMGSALTLVLRAQPRIAERSTQIQDGRAMIEQFTRELREGSALESPTASYVSFLTFVRRQQCGTATESASPAAPAIECRVSYLCADGACSRTEAQPDGSGAGPPFRVVDGLRSDAVFAYTPTDSPRHVTVTLEYPDDEGGESITLSDGAALRN